MGQALRRYIMMGNIYILLEETLYFIQKPAQMDALRLKL